MAAARFWQVASILAFAGTLAASGVEGGTPRWFALLGFAGALMLSSHMHGRWEGAGDD